MKSKIVRLAMTLVVLSALLPIPSIASPQNVPVDLPVEDQQPPAQVASFFDEGFVNVRVVAPEGTDLSKYGAFVTRRIPSITAGMSVYYGLVTEDALVALKANRLVADVARIQMQAEAPDGRPDPDVPTRVRPGMEETRARLTDLRDNPPEPTQREEPTGWWDVTAGGHNAEQAWDAGYTGDGVVVSVNDTGVDMAHPDFWGAEARYTNSSGDAYYDYFNGWPVALSPFANYMMAYDYELNGQLTDSNTFYHGTSAFADTSATGTGSTIVFSDTYQTSGTASPANPTYHIGYHPDWSLYGIVWGERIAVLVVDEDGNGVYDTVYVDLNNNKDFRDDKPVRKDTNLADNYAQGADELAWWDADLDGYPDVSGGMLYYISDDVHCPPFFDVYFGCTTQGGDYPPPGSGDVVAFAYTNLYDSDHGQLCASNVVGQGNINGPNPSGEFPTWKPDSMGGMVQGAGRDAKVVPVGDVYFGFEQSVEQAWWFQALGYDGVINNPGTAGGDDNMQASSNSFGPWYVYEDGWDEWSRIPTHINQFVNPYTTFFMSSGNTGGGYGTTGAPQPITAIQVGSSSQYGSTGGFELLESLDQITVGDTASYSSRGPSANNQLAPHVTANGAWASGAIGLNEVTSGWNAWDIWGGTSRSGPVAMAAGTLLMDAYEQNHLSWPTWFDVQQTIMQGANHIYNDPMTGGTGYVNAGRSAALAGGDYGVLVDSSYWDVGEYEGARYPGGFAHITEPGQVYTRDMTISNVSGADTVTVTVSDYLLEEIGIYTHTFTTVDQSLEDGEFLKPDYFFNVEDIVGGPLPGDTVLLVGELLHTFDTFDYGADDVTDSYFRLNGYDWSDLNEDGDLWNDLDGDGLVEWDEVDDKEYVRFNRGYDEAHYQILPIADPLKRAHDGIFLGVRHRQKSADVPTTPITLRVILYRQADWGALDVSAFGGSAFTLAGGNAVTQTVVFTAPADYGLYQGAVQVDVESASNESYTTIVPVFAQVAYSGDLTAEPEPITFGGVDDADQPYSNGYVRPVQDWWQGRATGGEWRFFFLNQENKVNDPGRQARLIARTEWDGDAPPADIDTFLLGPDRYFSSISNDPGPPVGSSYATPGAFWGPYSLRVTGRSESALISGGHWAFDTATGSNVDYAVGDFDQGLNSLQLHSHRYDGKSFRQAFSVDVGYVDAPSFLEWDNYATVPVTLTTNMTITEGITVAAFGLSPVFFASLDDQSVGSSSTGAFNACVATYLYTFTVPSDLHSLHVFMDDFGGEDLDLFLLYDGNGDGSINCSTEVVANSGNGAGAPEEITYANAAAGTYQVAVDPYTVSGPTTCDLLIDGLEMGDTIQVTNLNVDPFDPGHAATFDVLNKAGTCSDASQECLGGFVQVSLNVSPEVFLFDVPVNPRYNALDLSLLSYKEAPTTALPGDTLVYTIHVINTSTASDTVVVTDTLPGGVSLVSASPGYTENPTGTLVWGNVQAASGGGRVVSTDYDWADASSGTEQTAWGGYFGAGDDDEGLVTVTLPFTYTLFGTDYITAYVDANGQVQFGQLGLWGDVAPLTMVGDGLLPGPDGTLAYFTGLSNDNRIAVLYGDQRGPADIGGPGMGNPRLFTYYDDNDTPASPNDDRFIIQWDEWQLSWRSCYYMGIGCDVPYPDNTYQIILYPDGRAKAQYAEINELPPADYFGAFSQVGDAGVEGPNDAVGYAWHLQPASGMAWEYIPTITAETLLTVTAQITDTLDDTQLCNEAYLDNGHGQVTTVQDCTTVEQADITLFKTVDPSAAVTNDVVTFTVVITNAGPLSTTVGFTDTLDVGLAFGSFISGGVGFTNSGQVITGSVHLTETQIHELVYTALVTSTEYNDTLCNDAIALTEFGAGGLAVDCVTINELDLSDSAKYVLWDDPYPWPGTVVTYTVEVSNTSAITTSAWVTDVLPAEVTFGGIITPLDAGYITASRTITAYFATVAPGTSAFVGFTVTINSGLLRGTTVLNEAQIVDAAGDVWSVSKSFDVENADFSTSTKSGPSSAQPGEIITYTISLTNSGGLTGTAWVTDVIPLEVEVITPALALQGIDYEPSTRVISWTGVVTAPNGTVDLLIPVVVQRVKDGSVALNQAYINGGDATKVTSLVYTFIDSADLEATKWIESPWDGKLYYELDMPTGAVFTYTAVIENVGTISTTASFEDALPAGAVVVTPSLTAGASYSSTTHAVTWSGDIASGSAFTIEIPVYVELQAPFEDTILWNDFSVSDEWGEESDSNRVKVNVLSSNPYITKLVSNHYPQPGEVITYTIIARNTGSYTTTVNITDSLPSGVTYNAGTWAVVYGSGTASGTGPLTGDATLSPDIGANQEVRFQFAATVDSDVVNGVPITNTVTFADSDSGTAGLTGAEAVIWPRGADIVITKTVTPASVTVVDRVVTYTIEIVNNGDYTATNVLATDTLPTDLDFGSWVSQSGAAVASDEITWSSSQMVPGASTTIVFTADVVGGMAGDTITNTVQFTADNDVPGSDNAPFTLTGNYIYLPLVTRNYSP